MTIVYSKINKPGWVLSKVTLLVGSDDSSWFINCCFEAFAFLVTNLDVEGLDLVLDSSLFLSTIPVEVKL